MPGHQGLDRGAAPPAAKAKQMLDKIGGRWWNVYIGGPSSLASGWTPELVKEYARHGIDRFMITYAGQQAGGTLTRTQAQKDARQALELARRFGYSGDFPLCLDIEMVTFNRAPTKTVEYVRAWCAAVRKAGARPGVYANPTPLEAMAKGKVDADFVWIASWVSHGPAAHDPHAATSMPATLWSKPGQRAWQYAGEFNGVPCEVLGLNVDINVADLGCLAPPPGAKPGSAATTPARKRPLHKGDRGALVVRLTHRLSVVRSAKTEQPYLDGPRRGFDAEVEAALKAFQREHGLAAGGTYGRSTAQALLKATKKEQQRRRQGSPAGGGGNGTVEPTKLPQLVKAFQRLDAEADKAWQRIEAYGGKRRRQLARAGSDAGLDLGDVAAILKRIEAQLETLVELERREATGIAAAPVAQTYAPAEPKVEAEQPSPQVAVAYDSNGAPATPEAPTPRRLVDLSDDELDKRIDALDRRLDRARKERLARYVRVEKELVPHTDVNAGKAKQQQTKRQLPVPKQQQQPKTDKERVRALQRSLNRFSGKYLEGVAPLVVDGVRGSETNKRIRAAKFYLGYGDAERTTKLNSTFVRRLRHPRSPRFSGPELLARAERRRRQQRAKAKRLATAAIAGTPKQIVDAIALRIAAQCGINRSVATNDAANAAHGPTISGGTSDHQGPPTVAWAADISNGSSPTPEMDRLARALATRFKIPWDGAGLRNATHGGYRYQLIYRTMEGGNHYNHVHFGVRRV